ncbi:MAG: carboxypeptidase regulatory-like domain-containing protein [Elusimicrobia bacterium]|nr:carboxypeptidase regulatory-like domain-containing protein [Elusimicrobiota bacterium]
MTRALGLLTLILAGVAVPCFAVPPNLNVYVRKASDLSAIDSANVAVVSFGPNGPDASSSVCTTGLDGLCAVRCAVGKVCEVFATKQGFLPTLTGQMNDPAHKHVNADGTLVPDRVTLSTTPTVNIFLDDRDTTRVSKLGEIDLTLQNPTGAVVFGDVRPNSAASDVSLAYGISDVPTSLKIFNVPYAPLNSYKVGAFDPAGNGNKGVGIDRVVDVDINAANSPPNAPPSYTLNFTNGMPPSQVQNQTQQASGNGLSVDGMLIDGSDHVTPIAGIGINFTYVRSGDSYCYNCFDNRWVNTDQNGRFQLYGLQPNTRYYTTLNSGCNWQTNICYQGSQSAITNWSGSGVATNTALGTNDFAYGSTSTVVTLKLEMPHASGGTNHIAVLVHDQFGNALPQSGVNLGPDQRSWETSGVCTTPGGGNWQTNPGLANLNQQATTGYALLSGLPFGNYQLNIWTQFSQNQGTSFNAGTQPPPSGSSDPRSQYESTQGDIWGGSNPSCSGPGNSCLCPSGNWRLSLESSGHHLKVYSSSGTVLYDLGSVDAGNVPVLVATVTVPTANTGLVKGTLTFPSGPPYPDLTNDPINITIQPQCTSMSCSGQGGYAAIARPLTQNTFDYQIHVSSGYTYYMNVNSGYWGQVREGGGDNQVDLTSTGTVVVNMKFAPSGRVMGKLLKPDGSIFTPTNSGQNNVQPNISADGNNSYGWSQINPDGTYLIGGLLPNQYPLHVKAWTSGTGTFNYTDASPMPNVTVTANQDAYKDINLVKGVSVRIITSTLLPKLPPMTVSDCSQPEGTVKSDCPPEDFVVKAAPAGTVFDVDKLSSFVLKGGGGDDNTAFRFLPATTLANRQNLSGRICSNSNLVGPAFCVNQLPSPSNFDMYLTRKGGMDPTSGIRPYFTVLSSTRNVVVDDGHANSSYFWGSSTLTTRAVDFAPTMADMSGHAGARLTGNVAGNSIFLKSEFLSLGGNFDNFLKYIPLLALYDSNNAFKAVGSVIPNPACFNNTTPYGGGTPTVDAALNMAIANGDWSEFQSLFFGASSPCGGANSWGFDIRGLEAYKSYTAVLTTPNYPPYQFSVTMGADGSTNALGTIDLDAVVGLGGTINGLVVDATAAHNPIPNATVTVAAPGSKQKTFTTDASSGTFSAVGLADGNYTLAASAQGYALQAQSQAISKGNTVSVRLVLPAADAHIAGTVYAQKIPYVKLQSDALILARLEEGTTYQGDLALYKTYTSSIGVYQLDGLQSGRVYRVYVKAPSKMIMNATTMTIVGTVGGMDFTPTPKPLDVEVYGLPNGICASGTCLGTYDFTILNPSDFDSSSAKVYYGAAPYNYAVYTGTDVTNNFQNLPNNQVLLQIPLGVLDQTKDYVLHLQAYSILDRTKLVTKEITFGVSRSAGAELSIDDAILGDDTKDDRGHSANDALLDYTGTNGSAVTIPAGSLIPISSAAVPTLSFSAVAAAASTQAATVGNNAAFASPVYQIQLASANYGTDRGIDITLAYDKTTSNPSDLAVYHQDPQTGKFENLMDKGFAQTIDPVKSTITIKKLKSLASVLRAPAHLKAQATAHGLAPSAVLRPAGLRPDDVGVFGVLKPSVVSAGYTGGSIKLYNFPNPFSLDAKTRNIRTGASAGTAVTTNGTIIKIEVPPGVVGGHGTIRIYNLAGQMVREIDLGDNITGGNYYYSGWDGKNKNGADVANGVYYGILHLPGVKAGDGTFKMTVIK